MFLIMIKCPVAYAQQITFDEQTTKTFYRFSERQTAKVGISYNDKPGDTTRYDGELVIEPVGSAKRYYSEENNAFKFMFGPGYSAKQTFDIHWLPDTSIKEPYAIRLSIKVGGVKLPVEQYLYYLPQEVHKTDEAKIIKSNEALKADLNSLRLQLLNGDTSLTYIGKLILKKSATAIPSEAGDEIKMLKSFKILAGLDSIEVNVPTGDISDKANRFAYHRKEIDSVVMKISEGLIEHIDVKMKDGSYYTNLRAPLPLLNLQDRSNDKLQGDDDKFIFVGEVFNFKADQRFNYIPSDGHVYLTNNVTKPKTEQKLYANNGLNSFVDLRIFTDLLGALDNQPNGLLQVEGKSKIYLHRKNIPNTFMYLFHGMEPFIGISKLDSKYDTVKLNSVDRSLNRMDLYQRSFLKVGLKLNIYRWDFRPSNSLHLNGGYQFNAGNIAIRDVANKVDSVIAKGTFHTPFFEIGILSKRVNGFGFEGGARYLFQRINKNKHFSNSGYQHLMDFGVTAFYFVGKQGRDKFFVRYSNTLNFTEREQDFYQLQFGYSLSLKI
jgi:hypothetical protein